MALPLARRARRASHFSLNRSIHVTPLRTFAPDSDPLRLALTIGAAGVTLHLVMRSAGRRMISITGRRGAGDEDKERRDAKFSDDFSHIIFPQITVTMHQLFEAWR